MNGKSAKLLRQYAEVSGTPYRTLKKELKKENEKSREAIFARMKLVINEIENPAKKAI